MGKQRLEAFTDGVIAIIITIMVLDMRVPTSASFAALKSDIPVFLAYALSYVNVAIFWNNHHHMLHVTDRVTGRVLWGNLLLLFWLSLVPFAIRWMDQTQFASLPTAAYGAVLIGAALSYLFLQTSIILCNGGEHSKLARAIGGDFKGKISLIGYVLSVPLAFVRPAISIAIYVLIAMIWFIPDRRIESVI